MSLRSTGMVLGLKTLRSNVKQKLKLLSSAEFKQELKLEMKITLGWGSCNSFLTQMAGLTDMLVFFRSTEMLV